MKIGIISYWLNRGQGIVGRYLRSIFDELGHDTYVLARPTKDKFDVPRFIDTKDVWNQSGVTHASYYDIPLNEYLKWAKDNSLDVAFFDQNYQFEEIAELRKMGIKTIGRFVWETFSEGHVKDVKKAFDIIYSLTKCEQSRYASFGIDSPWLRWGCHPELNLIRPEKYKDGVYFFYPGGYLSRRKPTKTVIEAFTKVDSPDIRLIIKVQRKKRHNKLIGEVNNLDSRIRLISDDISSQEYYKLFSSCNICLAPSRWEGLVLHLYEAIAFGMPIITNNNPPMNEIVENSYNGILVESHQIGRAKSGIPAYEPDVDDLSRAIRVLSKQETLNMFAANTDEVRKKFSWDKTVACFREILSS